jgi:hypothetical protein
LWTSEAEKEIITAEDAEVAEEERQQTDEGFDTEWHSQKRDETIHETTPTGTT